MVSRSDEFEGQGQFRRPACGSGLCLEKNIIALVYNYFAASMGAKYCDVSLGLSVRSHI